LIAVAEVAAARVLLAAVKVITAITAVIVIVVEREIGRG
jgi:hypothetical protein